MTALWVVLAVLYGLFLYWHERRGPPLAQAETEAALAHLAANRVAADAADHDLPMSLRTLAAGDDGRQYFMVNLIQYREHALYPPGHEGLGTDARAADARYSRIVLPQLLKRGSYPIFVSRVVGAFIPHTGATKWDVVAIVRYRSRRDMLDMVKALQKLGGGMHKWAAIEDTHVFPVHAFIRVAPLPVVVLLFLLALGFSATALLS